MRLRIARRIAANLNTTKQVDIALVASREPLHDAAELEGLVPTDLKKQYDVREVIARIVDGSEFDEFKKLYGTTIVTGFAHLHGMPIGIIGNNGILYSESALKARAFRRTLLPAPHSAAVPAEHRRASWSAAITRPAASPRTAPRW